MVAWRFRSLRTATSRFRRAEGGNIALLFAFASVPLLAAVGAAVDYSRAASARSTMGVAADAAALAAATEAKRRLEGGADDTTAFAGARQVALQVYGSIMRPGVSTADPIVDMGHAGMAVTARITAAGAVPTLFGAVLNTRAAPVGIAAAATVSLTPYVDVSLLVDVSGSMAIGADQNAVNTLNAQLGCAFACHDGSPVKGTAMDAYQWAIANGIPLRTQSVNRGVGDFLDWLGTQTAAATYDRVGIYAFSDGVTQTASYSSNMTLTKQNLPQQTSAASEYTAATHFNEIMPTFTQMVGPSGDGSSRAAAKKLVIIATDGVEDPNRTWTYNLALRPLVTAFDPASCQALKDAGVTIGVIHTAYVPLTWDWGYQATLGQPSQIGGPGTRVDDIGPQLQRCASPGLYQIATSDMIGQAFQKIYATFALTRITN